MSAPSGKCLPAVWVRASLPRRLGALLYEVLSLGALLLVAGFVLLPLTPRFAGGAPPGMPAPWVRTLWFLAMAGVLVGYCVWFWSEGRRTLAMKTWRLHLVRGSGAALDRRTALLRHCAGWIGPVLALAAYLPLHSAGHGRWALAFLAANFAWALADPDRQFLHDRLAGTELVTDRRGRSAG